MPENTTTHIASILTILEKTYPDAKIALLYKSPWELLVAVILSAQCTDVMVNKVTSKLFQKYPHVSNYVNANADEFEQDIRSTGFYRMKAKNILASAGIIASKFHGMVPKTMDEMLTLPGVARKTANIVLRQAYGVVVGIAVDTHVIRLSQRLRFVPFNAIGGKKGISFKKNTKTVIDFIKDANPGKIEALLMKCIPKTMWARVTYQLIDHGRSICKAHNPKCAQCPLFRLCPASRI